MPAKPTIAKFNKAVEKFANALKKQAKRDFNKEWLQAYADIRFPSNDERCSCVCKILAEVGEGYFQAMSAFDKQDPIMQLVEMKDFLFDPKLYGIKIIVFPDGRFVTEHNHDVNWFNDPKFQND